MADIQKIPWKRLSVEAAAIVASILLAFAIDAWWDHRNDLIVEDEILRDLEDEFIMNRERLLEVIEFTRAYTQGVQRLLTAYESGTFSSDSIESMGVDLWGSMSWRTANLSTATLDSVLSAGHLALIQNRPLRAALAGWPSRLDDMAEEEMFEWQEVTERYRPFVGRIVPIPSLEFTERKPPEPDALRRLMESVEFRSLISMRLDISLIVLDDKYATLTELNRILDLIEGTS